jgi:uncharacterized membrane protein (DUF106 family)
VSSKVMKLSRRAAHKKQMEMMKGAMREIMTAPFKTRLAFCWLVLKGKK